MKSNFLNNFLIKGKFSVYDDYQMKKDTSFINSELKYTIGPSPEFEEDGNWLKEYLGSYDFFEYFNEDFKYVISQSTFNKERVNQKAKTVKYDFLKFGRTFYTELAKVDMDDQNILMNFFRTWGLLCGTSFYKIPFGAYSKSDLNITLMPLREFERNLDRFKSYFSLIKRRHDKKTDILPAIQLAQEGNYNTFTFSIDGNQGSPEPVVIFNDMFDYAEFFLLLAFYGEAEFRKCENCGHLFEVIHQRQRFCSVLPGRKRSSCEMAYNNRRKKNKK